MIDQRLWREKPDFVKESAKAKGVTLELDRILELDVEKRRLQTKIDAIRSEKNVFSKTIGRMSPDERKQALAQLKLKDKEADKLHQELKKIESDLMTLLLDIPNIPASDVTVGADERANQVLRKHGVPRVEASLDYLGLAHDLHLLDIERAAKVSGSRFGYIKNELVVLEFAIVHWAFQVLRNKGFQLLVPPVLIRDEAMEAMGYLAHGGKDETYHLDRDGLYLVGTSEQSVGPMHMNEIFSEEQLPLRYSSFSTCFRREAGSYGRDTKGILRVHQFDKIEMFSFTQPEDSDKEHEFLLAIEEELVQALKLPYQVIKMCTGDLGAPAARKYDIETWIPSENKYRETHSTSNCTDFQARRLNIRFRRRDKKAVELVHTLNGTAFAIGRILIAILENYQRADGSVQVPAVLVPYVGFETIAKK